MANKPECKLSGTDGNVFALSGRVGRALKEAGLLEKRDEFYSRIRECKSYDEALTLMSEYVEVY